eukprot:TRINITY_DN10855_c0_g2_i1.p1 TRINITY_DN10855_c0_g2~~TRINITY_DN10855_c0_g2_i1.p1  ORF type:complete len:211 (+),score=89.16 TRINITY_DN10855_c0_g2_i1:54-635(+)
MAEAFRAAAGDDYQPFGLDYLTPAQEGCYALTCDVASRLMAVRGRDRQLKELTVCIGGLGEHDEDEPLEQYAFSTRRFWHAFVITLVSGEDKFDFLVLCLEAGVCVVAEGFEDRYRSLVAAVLRSDTPVQDPDKPVLSSEPDPPSDPATWRDELQALEAEQHAVEQYRRERVFPHWYPCTAPGAGYPPQVRRW